MSYLVHLRKNATGEVEVREMGEGVDWGPSSEFWLCCGNFGCDCNRESLWTGGDLPDECSSGKYTILKVTTRRGDSLWKGDEAGCGGACVR